MTPQSVASRYSVVLRIDASSVQANTQITTILPTGASDPGLIYRMPLICSETYISVRTLGRESLSRMSNNQQVLNVTTGEKMKLKQAKKLVLEGRLLWEVENESVRSVTFADLSELKHTIEHYARLRAPLSSPELPGLRYAPPATENTHTFLNNRRSLITQAREFVGAAQ